MKTQTMLIIYSYPSTQIRTLEQYAFIYQVQVKHCVISLYRRCILAHLKLQSCISQHCIDANT